MVSNVVFAVCLLLLAVAPSLPMLCVGWAVIGLGMGIGFYEVGFATLAGTYGQDARGPITGITLIAGFASTVGWPLSGLMLATCGAIRRGGIRAADRLAQCARPRPSGCGAHHLRRCAYGLGPRGDLADRGDRRYLVHRFARPQADMRRRERAS
jgi:MFS family permease